MQPIFQDPYSSLNPRKTIFEIITLPLSVHKVGTSRDWLQKAREMMDLCGLASRYLNSYPSQLSGGQRQRVAIARALVMKPEVVICDEPTSALDVSVQSQILNLLMDLKNELGLTYLLISHNLAVVEHLADRVAVMYVGRIVEMSPTDELFLAPKHPYTAALLSAVPVADPRIRSKIQPLEGDVPSPSNPPSGCHFHPRCPFATDLCRQQAPDLEEVRPYHFVACHRQAELSLLGVSEPT